MMLRLIDADALLKRLSLWLDDYDFIIFKSVKDDINDAPTVDAEPVRHGHWRGVNPMVDTVECSECGYQIVSEELITPYCPNCGAKMDEEREDA